MTAIAVALGAALGGAVRHLVSRRWDGATPWGTWSVNVAGSALVGLCGALALSGLGWALAATGFCGGLTTWSTFAVQCADMARDDRAAARRYAAVTVAASLSACAGAFALVTALA